MTNEGGRGMQSHGEVGMVGLGLMGTAMSSCLLKAGRGVRGYDVVDDCQQAHLDRGGAVASGAAEVASSCSLVILSLPNGDIVRNACLESGGVLEGAKPGTLIVDTTTIRPKDAISLGTACAEKNVTYLDAGISGHSGMVARGEALGVVGGPVDAMPTVGDVLGAFCRKVMHAGAVGDGMRAKLVINHVLTINRFALAEGLVLAEKSGMEPQTTLDILRESAAYSTAMNMWGERMVTEDYSPPVSRVEGGNKDLQLILELGRESGASMFALTQVGQVVQSMLAAGLGGFDNAVLAEMLRRLAGIGRFEGAE